MVDANQADDKIIAVLEGDLAYGAAQDLSDIPQGVVDRLRHYFLTYKQLPLEAPRKVEIPEIYGREEACEMIRLSTEDYREKFGPPEQRLALLRSLLTRSEAGP